MHNRYLHKHKYEIGRIFIDRIKFERGVTCILPVMLTLLVITFTWLDKTIVLF